MRYRLLGALLSVILVASLAWGANNVRFPLASGDVGTFKTTDTGGVHTLHVNIDSGGAGSGAVTVADGADVALGARADAAWSGSGSGTLVAIQKAAWSKLDSILTAAQGAIPAGTNAIGKVVNQVLIGGAATDVQGCRSTAKYDASTTGSTEIVALTGGQTVRICGFHFTTGGTATNVKLVYGTGTNCATGAADITPAYQLAANDKFGIQSPVWQGLATAVSNALCINASAANAVQALVFYDKS